MREALVSINAAVEAGDKQALLTALMLEEARLTGVNRDNLQWYMDILTRTQKDNAKVRVLLWHHYDVIATSPDH